MVFFFSVGLLVDPKFIFKHITIVCVLLAVVTVGKTIINIVALKLMKIKLADAFLIGVVLAQIGEFGFLLANVGYESKIINSFGEKLILSLTALSLLFSPICLAIAKTAKSISDKSDLRLYKIYKFFSMPYQKILRLLWKKATREIEHEEHTFDRIREHD